MAIPCVQNNSYNLVAGCHHLCMSASCKPDLSSKHFWLHALLPVAIDIAELLLSCDAVMSQMSIQIQSIGLDDTLTWTKPWPKGVVSSLDQCFVV